MNIQYGPPQNVLPVRPIQPSMLKKAAQGGDLSFLQHCVSVQMPYDSYLTQFEDGETIMHIAIRVNRTKFVVEMFRLLATEVLHQLMLSKTTSSGQNPLHVAAFMGKVEVVKLILNYYRYQPSLSLRPWLDMDALGQTPCHTAVVCKNRDCALEIVNMDTARLSSMLYPDGTGLLFAAVECELYMVAKRILLNSPPTTWTIPFPYCTWVGWTESQYMSPLHILPRKSDDQEFFRLLVEKIPDQVRYVHVENILVTWAKIGKVWPFEYIVENCNDIIPDVRSLVVRFMSTPVMPSRWNPFHFLAENAHQGNDVVKIADFLIRTFRREVARMQPGQYHPRSFPWLAQDQQGRVPLDICLDHKNDKLASFLLSVQPQAYANGNFLVYVIRKGCQEVAEKILDYYVDPENWTELRDNYTLSNALHVAPYCGNNAVTFLNRLLNGNPKLLEEVDNSGRTILHSWAENGHAWALVYILKECESTNNSRWNQYMFPLVGRSDYSGNTIFHYVVSRIQDGSDKLSILKQLASVFRKRYPSCKTTDLPWIRKNHTGEGALHVAMSGGHCQEDVALTILSLSDDVADCHKLLDYYKPHHSILFLAMQMSFFKVAKNIMLKFTEEEHWRKYAKNSTTNENILHLAVTCADKELAKWLIKNAPEFVLEEDEDKKKTPLAIACDECADSIIREILNSKSPKLTPELIFKKAPPAWIGLCKKGQTSTLLDFIERCPGGDFKKHCAEHQTSPLHHVDNLDKHGYEDLLRNEIMKKFVDFKDSEGETPLHIAIEKKNKTLTRALLSERAPLKMRNNAKKTARSLLIKKSKEDESWNQICQDYEINFNIKKDNIEGARNTFAVVAALIATITFTAGFTLPGGFNQDTGKAILAKDAAFLVFLIFDTIALCSSMLVLTCLIVSLIFDNPKAQTLINQSLKLLMFSLYSTMVAFMCAVFEVIFRKSLWAAIVVILICSLLVVSVKKALLYTLVDKLLPSDMA